MMKMFHRAMKIRKYRRLSRNSLMLSPRIETDVTLFYAAQLVKVVYIYLFIYFNNAITPVVSGLDSSPNPWDSFLWLQNIRLTKLLMVMITIGVTITTFKMNKMAPFWKNTHSLKFNTAPAFTNKVLQKQTQTEVRRLLFTT